MHRDGALERSRHLEPDETEALLRIAARIWDAHGWPAKLPAR